MRTMITPALALILLLGTAKSVLADSPYRTTPEQAMRGATLVVEGRVTDVKFHTFPNSAMGHASVMLSVADVIKGSASKTLTLQRHEVNDEGKYLSTRLAPVYREGDHVIVALRWDADGFYAPMGAKNGTFHLANGTVQGANVSTEAFKTQIQEVLSGTRQQFSGAVPHLARSDLEAEAAKLSSTADCQEEAHFDGRFDTFNTTWDESSPTVHFKYNHVNAPGGVSLSTVESRIQDAFATWNALNLSQVEFQYDGTTSKGQAQDGTNVISWQSLSALYGKEYGEPDFFASPTMRPQPDGPRHKNRLRHRLQQGSERRDGRHE